MNVEVDMLVVTLVAGNVIEFDDVSVYSIDVNVSFIFGLYVFIYKVPALALIIDLTFI